MLELFATELNLAESKLMKCLPSLLDAELAEVEMKVFCLCAEVPKINECLLPAVKDAFVSKA